ncbi:hypothetical protein AaE_010965 [Aphanomyces astaci]|uniref:Uncharacterized protein n=1 Tax=Aphanomyces astaci TaxID=112090 RepID=A0A6A5A268_APHAT|nr:hypothetical protein AaE_010965 [Aphanomyces astaci]
MERDTAAVNASMQKAAKKLQDAIMGVRKARQNQPMHSQVNVEETLPRAAASSRHGTLTSKALPSSSSWLHDEYLESSDSEMEEHDDVSIGSTMSDEDLAEEDNQLSACTSPTKSTEQRPHNELRHSSASGSLPSINDRFADPLPSDPRTAAVDSMIDQMKLKMDELSELKATIMHTFVHACGRIDAFVRSTTGQPPRLHHVEVMPDIQHMDQVVTRWERSLADWNMRVREDLAHECRREVLGMQQAWRLQEDVDQDNRMQMAMEDGAAAMWRRWHRSTTLPFSIYYRPRAPTMRIEMSAKMALQREEANEAMHMHVEDWQSRCMVLNTQLRHARTETEAHKHGHAMLRLQLTSIDARLQEAIHQVHMQEEIAAHVQSTQEHNMREVEALNYKLLNTLVDQDRQLQLKEAAMLERIQAIDADRAQLRCEHLAFEQQKKAILSDLKNVCDYFSTYESSHPSSSAKVI